MMPGEISPETGSFPLGTRRVTAAALLGLMAVFLVAATLPLRADDGSGTAFFESRIRPVLIDKCYGCHSARAAKLKGGLRLDDRESTLKGGDSGPAVVPGKPEESLLLQAIAGTGGLSRMPPKATLSVAVIADFRRWIERGAADPRDLAGEQQALARPLAARVTGRAALPPGDRDGSWWSLRPVSNPPVPSLDDAGRVWARTPIDAFILAKLQEKGLKPSPEADRRTLIRRLSFDLLGLPPSPEEVNAFLIDASPDAYERLVDRLLASPHHGERWARHWMDLVHFAETHGHDQDRIRPNAWPYRDYLIESFNQDRPYARFIQEQVAADALFPGEPRLVPALGMIAAGPWDESSLRDIRDDSIDRQVGHYLDRDDMVSTVMSHIREHDGSLCRGATTTSSTRSPRTTTTVSRPCSRGSTGPIGPSIRIPPWAAFAACSRSSSACCHIMPLPGASSSRRLPPRRLVYAAASEFAPDGSHKPARGPRPVHVLKRGDINKRGAAAVPGGLACVASLKGRFALPDPRNEGSRRAALARWLSDPRNPLTYRSIVNRLWQHHFGRGIVDSPSDFGRMGSLPTHPELLDWLAAWFLAEGGSLKRMHRLIVTSAVYRQATRYDHRAAEIDADNRLLWRMNRRRLDAESVHDAMLQAAGRLDQTMRGPSVQQFSMRPGVHVTPVIDYSQYDWNGPGAGRRSVYRFLFRTLPDPFMDNLDEADASQLTAARTESITPLQALALLNDPFVLRQSERLTERLEHARPGLDDQISLAFQLLFNRPPTLEEQADLGGYAHSHGLVNLCRLLFNSNEFLYVN